MRVWPFLIAAFCLALVVPAGATAIPAWTNMSLYELPTIWELYPGSEFHIAAVQGQPLDYSPPQGRGIWGLIIHPQDYDTYYINLTFVDGTVITGQIIRSQLYPLIGGTDLRVELGGQWDNSTAIVDLTPFVSIRPGYVTSDSGNVVYLTENYPTEGNGIVLPLTKPMQANPIVRLQISSASGGEAPTVDIGAPTFGQIMYTEKKAVYSGAGFLDFIKGVYSAFLIGWIFIDFLFVQGYALLILVFLWIGMIDYNMLVAPNIFIAIKRSANDTALLFDFIYRTAYYLAMAIKQFVDLINPLKWIV